MQYIFYTEVKTGGGNVMGVCVCTKRVCVRFTELVCKAVRLAFLCQANAISFPFTPIPCVKVTILIFKNCSDLCGTFLSKKPLKILKRILYPSRKLTKSFLELLF